MFDFFKKTRYRSLDSSLLSPPAYTESYAEIRSNYDCFGLSNAEICKTITPPDNCERCCENPAQIRLINKTKGNLEFICYVCRERDDTLKNIPVASSKIPSKCCRCNIDTPKYKAVMKDTSNILHICSMCYTLDFRNNHMFIITQL
jgi:hypothetical protein